MCYTQLFSIVRRTPRSREHHVPTVISGQNEWLCQPSLCSPNSSTMGISLAMFKPRQTLGVIIEGNT